MPKRLRDGHVKRSTEAERGTKSLVGGKVSDFKADILALGGSVEDYELIADAPSDSEFENNESTKGLTKALETDLRKMVRELGIDKAVPDVESDSTSIRTDPDDGHDSVKPVDSAVRKSNLLTQPKGGEPMAEVPKPSKIKTKFPVQSEWHAATLPALTPSFETEPLPLDLIDRLHEHAKTLLEADNKLYGTQNKSATSAHQFYSTVMISGTLSDKVSALTLSVQESPLHNMKALESLLSLAGKRSRGQAVEVLGALKDLFGPGALLPPDRKLLFFANQPRLFAAFAASDFTWKANEPLPKPLEEEHLIAWAYEDWLKSVYFQVIKIIETWCNDEVVFAQGKAVDYVYQLLREKPEQEANLLRLLVNKLGDSDKKVASKTSYSLLQLQVPHPLMRSTIISAIEADLLFRPGQSLHAKYYAVITLNQTSLSAKQDGVTKQLLAIYFDLFTQLLAKPSPSSANTIVLNKKGDVQGGGGAAGKKSRKKKVERESTTTSDDQLREKILSAILTGVNRAIPYTNTNNEAFEKHMDTLFKVTHSTNFNTGIQALMLIQQLAAVHPSTADRFYRTLYESLLDPRLLTTSKQALYLNLLYRAMSADLSVKRVKAFVKRLLQVAALHQASFASAAIYLVRELEGVFPSLRPFIDQHQEAESEEEEDFRDVLEDGGTPDGRTEAPMRASNTKKRPLLAYDGRKRDPQHSNADGSCVWELTLMLKYYHPAVALFASKLATHEAMPPKPDLSSNTLSQFLDRFVYRNPKLKTKPRGASIMQPLAGGDTSGLLVATQSRTCGQAPINSDQFSSMAIDKIAADEVFFHKYFSTVGKGKQQAKKKKEKRKARVTEGSGAEEDEDEIWQALVNSRPELEGSDDEEMESLPDDAGDVSSAEDVDALSADEGSADGEGLDLDEKDEELIASDDELPDHMEMAFVDDIEPSTKPKFEGKAGKAARKKKRKLKSLPVFASADDYAKILDGDD